jgi:hypothetical protein
MSALVLAGGDARGQDAGALLPPIVQPGAEQAGAAPPETTAPAPGLPAGLALPSGLQPRGPVFDTVTDIDAPLTHERHGLRCDGVAPCEVVATAQPLRVLPRSLSALVSRPEPDAPVIQSSVDGLRPVFVYDIVDLNLSRPARPQGYYQVGATADGPEGFLSARDALEWRQALVLHFEHPGQGSSRRQPTLFFDTIEALHKVVASPERAARAAALRDETASGATSGGVIAREPENYVDITERLYVYPILEWRRDETSVEKARYLRALTASPGRRNPNAAQTIDAGGVVTAAPSASSLAELDVDIVFVLDMTGSMQPYIDAVRNAVTGGATAFGEEFADARQVRFGLVGYRDNAERTPSLQFQTRNFTEDALVDVATLSAMLENGGRPLASRASADEWAEAVLPGLREAIKTTPWSSERSLRMVILIGDASGHEPGHPAYEQGVDSASLRKLADDNNVSIVAAYVKNARAETDWVRAQAQLDTLTLNPGAQEASSGMVEAEMAGFSIEALLLQYAQNSRLSAEAALARQAPAPDLPASAPASPAAPAPVAADSVDEIARRWGDALTLGVVDYLGDAQEPPRDFTGWVLDNDLGDPNRRAISVRVLISRDELDTVVRRQEFLIDSLKDAELSQRDFFASLQDLSARAGLDVAFERDQTFEESRFLPNWIAALPYRSEVLSLTPRDFEEMSSQDQLAFQRRVEGKLALHREILSDTRGWFDLQPGADSLRQVYPLDIEALP